jgi:PD-(D/E)XK nuclease superfamily
VELIDFKLAANRPPAENHESQLRLYAEAARILGLNPVRLVIHNLDVDNPWREDIEEDEAAKSAFKSQLHEWISGIAGASFGKKPNKKTYAACDFVRFCNSRRS